MVRRGVLSGLLALIICLVASQPAQAGLVQGSILNIDVLNNSIHVIQPDGKVFVFTRTADTIVTLNGQPYRFELLQPGWRVKVKFHNKTSVAIRIDAFNL
jgi:hypothetical protein